MNRRTPAILALIVINAVFFAATYLAPGQLEPMMERFALYFPQNDQFRVWQFVSYMFMHGSLGHIVLNMFGLFMFGSPLERLWGARRFVIFFLATGVGAALIHVGINMHEFGATYRALADNGASAIEIQRFLDTAMIHPRLTAGLSEAALEDFLRNYHAPMVGASGGVYGVLVAFAVMFPNVKLALLFLPVPIAAKYFVPLLLLLDLFSGITGFSLFGGGIAHFAHVGGGVIGFLLMIYWRRAVAAEARRRFD